MTVSATAKSIRISPRKARLVVDQVRGASVVDAERQLKFMQKKAAEPVLKLILSATANAEHNHKMKKDNLFVKIIKVDEGFTMKRYRARAFGRASQVRKRTCRIHVEVAEIKPTEPKKKAKTTATKPAAKKGEKKTEATKPAAKKTTKESK